MQASFFSLFGQFSHLHAPGGQEQDPPHLDHQLDSLTRSGYAKLQQGICATHVQVEALVESQSQALALPLLGQLAHLQAPGGQEQDPPQLQCQLTPILPLVRPHGPHYPPWSAHGYGRTLATGERH